MGERRSMDTTACRFQDKGILNTCMCSSFQSSEFTFLYREHTSNQFLLGSEFKSRFNFFNRKEAVRMYWRPLKRSTFPRSLFFRLCAAHIQSLIDSMALFPFHFSEHMNFNWTQLWHRNQRRPKIGSVRPITTDRFYRLQADLPSRAVWTAAIVLTLS